PPMDTVWCAGPYSESRRSAYEIPSCTLLTVSGQLLTGATVFFQGSTAAALNHKKNFQGFVNVFSNPFEKGFALVFPDKTVNQLVQLDNQTLRDAAIVPNNTQQRTLVFLNRDMLQQRPIPSQILKDWKASSQGKKPTATTDQSGKKDDGLRETKAKMKSR